MAALDGDEDAAEEYDKLTGLSKSYLEDIDAVTDASLRAASARGAPPTAGRVRVQRG